MKQVLAAITSLVFVGSVSAASDADIYHGFADGNPDLSTEIKGDQMITAGQPGVGDSSETYRVFARGNNDLYSSVEGKSQWSGGGSQLGYSFGDSDIYHGFEEGNPDL